MLNTTMPGPSPTFCVLPWIHRFTNIAGEIQVCCSSEERDNGIRADDGRLLKAPQDLDDHQIMNSRYMRELRLKMLAGEWPAVCERCRLTEECGGRSRRHAENQRFKKEEEWARQNTQPDGSIPIRVLHSDFRLGNLCNLACRMCSPRSSSKWLAEASRYFKALKLAPPSLDEFRQNDKWYESDEFLDYFKRSVSSLEYLHFAGGEPLISPKIRELLKFCVESGRAKHIELSYNTNLTRIPDELKSLWPEFRGVRLYCSIDAIGPLHELIRYPSRWSDVDENLHMIEREHRSLGITEVLIMCTVQVYNILRLGELYDYLAENFRFVGQIPYLSELHFPVYNQTSILPPELKQLALQRLRQVEERTRRRIAEGMIPEHLSYMLESLNGAMNYMQATDLQARIPDFLQAVEAFDTTRGDSTFKVVPELNFLKL